jgi:hypothetical protein
MERRYRIKLANAATDWSNVLEQQLIEKIMSRLTTRRSWTVEEAVVEADEAGWFASTTEGATRFGLALTVPARSAVAPPPEVIEWTLVAYADLKNHDNVGRVLFGAIMLATGAAFGLLTWHLQGPGSGDRIVDQLRTET